MRCSTLCFSKQWGTTINPAALVNVIVRVKHRLTRGQLTCSECSVSRSRVTRSRGFDDVGDFNAGNRGDLRDAIVSVSGGSGVGRCVGLIVGCVAEGKWKIILRKDN